MFILTKLAVSMITGKILEYEGFEYLGPIEFACGATSAQNQIESTQQNYYTTLTSQAQAEYGQASRVFNDIYSAMAPIVDAGPNQQGFSAAELSNLNANATTGAGQAYSSAAQSARQQEAAAGGSDFVPTGANEQINAEIGAQGAAQESNSLNQIEAANYSTGRSNYFTAAGDLVGASGAYGASTGAANAATGAGSAASNTANQIAQEDNSWMQAVSGVLGGTLGGVTSGGMSNLGKGVGFFGQNAPSPSPTGPSLANSMNG
jgi:hypothetical protein